MLPSAMVWLDAVFELFINNKWSSVPQRNKLYLALNKQAEVVSRINFVEGLFKGFIDTKKDIKPHRSYLMS